MLTWLLNWRRDPESNWARRICNPLHNRFAIAPDSEKTLTKKGSFWLPFLLKDVGTSFNVWSGKRGSNSRPQPWQGCALPTELFPRISEFSIICLVRCDERIIAPFPRHFEKTPEILHQCFTASTLGVAATAETAAAATSSSLKGTGLASSATSRT